MSAAERAWYLNNTENLDALPKIDLSKDSLFMTKVMYVCSNRMCWNFISSTNKDYKY